jgi:cobalt/nickel transport system permease protein
LGPGFTGIKRFRSMSHIHFPDGILPPWLWISGFMAAILAWVLLLRFTKKEELPRRLPLLGMMAAIMVLGASVEIVPIAYHVNLTVISGILLGPSFIFMATFVVNVILALFGHGGITVIGLNTLTLSIEGILGYSFFRLFHRLFKRLGPATFFATFFALSLSTGAMIGIVSLGTPHYGDLIHHEKGGVIDFNLLHGKEGHPGGEDVGKEVNLGRFIAVVLPLGFIGWILESLITTLMVKYIFRLRPDLLRLGEETP